MFFTKLTNHIVILKRVKLEKLETIHRLFNFTPAMKIARPC